MDLLTGSTRVTLHQQHRLRLRFLSLSFLPASFSLSLSLSALLLFLFINVFSLAKGATTTLMNEGMTKPERRRTRSLSAPKDLSSLNVIPSISCPHKTEQSTPKKIVSEKKENPSHNYTPIKSTSRPVVSSSQSEKGALENPKLPFRSPLVVTPSSVKVRPRPLAIDQPLEIIIEDRCFHDADDESASSACNSCSQKNPLSSSKSNIFTYDYILRDGGILKPQALNTKVTSIPFQLFYFLLFLFRILEMLLLKTMTWQPLDIVTL